MKMLKHSKIGKVLKGLSLGARSSGGGRRVPEGHFVVVAVKGEEAKRFTVKLDCLRDPAFLRLLERAGEEYGFAQKGPLAVPCNPQELQSIIDNHMRCRP
ncbi:auxin-responsive protein SAUR32-like [Prosopis cineraria]|nr:auxin-responsive protein SAUR32-like [Prosopis cineraria]